MTMHDTHLALLPAGFVDLLPPEAAQEFRAISKLMKIFAAFGYERIKPPLVEFEDSLLAPGPGAALAGETFRLMDPVTHRMMGIRSDITPQTARIASSRLAGRQRPLRLAYANDVLRTKASQQRTERQFCQVGCELIGADSIEAEIESCVVSLIGIDALNIKSITIDLCLPQLIQKVFKQHNVSESDQKDFRKSIERRERDSVDKLGGDAAKIILKLIDASGAAEKALDSLKSLDVSEDIKVDIRKLESVCEGVERALKELGLDVEIGIDPLESKGFEYHSAIGFTLFAKDVRGELGRGGRYDVRFGAQIGGETATGFTLYMDTIRKALPETGDKDIVNVPAEESWKKIRSMQEKGKIVLRAAERKKK